MESSSIFAFLELLRCQLIAKDIADHVLSLLQGLLTHIQSIGLEVTLQ